MKNIVNDNCRYTYLFIEFYIYFLKLKAKYYKNDHCYEIVIRLLLDCYEINQELMTLISLESFHIP